MLTKIQKRLLSMADADYKQFQCSLIPTVAPERVIGVRTPMLRAFAKEIGAGEAETFLSSLPHRYYEEYNLHALLIMRMTDFDRCISAIERLLPYIDNWASCDILRPKVPAKSFDGLMCYINRWINSDKPYTIRFGIEMLMLHFLDEGFNKTHLDLVCDIKSDEYYVNMMRAWYFAEALAKQYDKALPLFKSKRLDTWTHNKAIQKARESLRITPEQKQELNLLKIRK